MGAVQIQHIEPEAQIPAKSSGIVRALVLVICFWAVPAVWVWLTPPFSEPHKPATRTRQRLATLNKALHGYVADQKKTPSDLSALRAYAHNTGTAFDAYDAFGQRFDYLKLDDEHYLLRSFGEDGMQNTVASQPDMGVVNWGPRPVRPTSYKFPVKPTPDVFPAVLLAGADSPGGQWLARVYVDAENQTRSLLVRHRSKTGLFMAAHHDAVEEFLWLPNGKEIVFTATASVRHRDGIYLWNLETDAVVNLIDHAAGAMPISPTSRGAGLWLALAGVSQGAGTAANGATVYAYWGARHDGTLDPAEFFHPGQLLAFELPPKGQPRVLEPPALGPAAQFVPIARPLSLAAHIEGLGGLRVQQSWLTLPLTGDMEKVLLAWHKFSEKEAQSPLFPYCLWLLSSLYSESFQVMAARDGRDADVLRTFGTEIARALLNYPLAPSYLRSLALHTYESLMEGQPLPYRFAQLSASGPVVEAPPALLPQP